MAVDLDLPAHPFAEGTKLLLTFHATCATQAGGVVERTRLPGRHVRLDHGDLTEVDAQRPDGEGTLLLDGPLGVWTASAQQPAYDPDDDPSQDHAHEGVTR